MPERGALLLRKQKRAGSAFIVNYPKTTSECPLIGAGDSVIIINERFCCEEQLLQLGQWIRADKQGLHKNAREQNNKGGTALMTSLTLVRSVGDFLCLCICTRKKPGGQEYENYVKRRLSKRV